MTDWIEKEDSLQRSFKFKDFTEAFAFMTEVALAAEKIDHHPTWINVYHLVDIKLNTHSAGNIVTDKDRNLAAKINSIFTKYEG